ncbi:MAG TPA: biotin/lipoyl-containing protein [Acidobacteriaceae bacterium]|nr:biotin/lipoyl-containing protein [Acidobacteriaceae bacterium]
MKIELEIEGRTRAVEIVPGDIAGRWNIQIDGAPVEADACLLRPGVLSLLIGGQSYRVVLDGDPGEPALNGPALHLGAHRFAWQADDPRSFRRRRRHGGAEGPITLKASMPGRVVRVLVERGAHVAAHQGIVVIEAMKMQNELKSPREGRVAELRVAPGDTVASGQTLAVIE